MTQQSAMHPTFEHVLRNEQLRFNRLGNKLLQFSEISAESKTLEQIYASFSVAYSAGVEALDRFGATLTQLGYLEQGYHGRLTPEQAYRIQGVPPEKQRAIFHIMACLEILESPSDVFRAELVRQNANILAALEEQSRDPTITPQGFYENVQYVVQIICSFDIDSAGGALDGGGGGEHSWWKYALAGAGGFIAGAESGFHPLEEFKKLINKGL